MKKLALVIPALILTSVPAPAYAGAEVPPQRVITQVFKTDTLATTVTIGLNGRGAKTVLYRLCVNYRSGHSRTVRYENGGYVNITGAVPRPRVTRCWYPNTAQVYPWARVSITEDLPGPLNLVSRKNVYVW